MEKIQKEFEIQSVCHEFKDNQMTSQILEIGIKRQLQQQNQNIQNDQKKHFLVVVDNSGSMGGEFMTNTNKVSLMLVEHILKSYQNPSIQINEFNNTVTEYPELHKKDHQQIKQLISGIKAGGGTCFTYAINSINDYIKKNKSKDLTLVFLTDGQVNSHIDTGDQFAQLKAAFEQTKTTIDNEVKTFQIHTLGLGKNHNTAILDKIINLKTTLGTYQFIKTSQDIDISFEVIRDIMSDDYYQYFLGHREDDKLGVEELFFQSSGQAGEQSCILDLSTMSTDLQKIIASKKAKLTIMKNNEKLEEFNLDFTPNQIQDSLLELRISINLLENKIKKYLNEIKNIINKWQKLDPKPKMDQFVEDLKQMKEENTQKTKKIFKIKGNEQIKGNLIQKLGLMTENLKTSDECLAAILAQKIDSSLIAEVNALAYQDIQSKLFKKRLGKRKKASTLQFEDYMKQVEIQSTQLISQKDELMKMEEEAEEYGTCFLTTYNFLEAIFDQDCLCFTFSVKRSELAIVRPECLEIVQMFPTIISAKSFLQSVQHALKLQPMNHGGFQKEEDIPNIRIFLAQIFLANELNWIKLSYKQEDIDKFFNIVIEEHLRREVPQNQVWGMYKLEKLIVNKDNSYMSEAYNLYYDLVKKEALSLFIFKYMLLGQNHIQIQNQIEKQNMLELLLLPNQDALNCLLAQNMIQKENRVRRNSVMIKQYFDPWTQYQEFFAHFKSNIVTQGQEYIQTLNVKKRNIVKGSIYFNSPTYCDPLVDQLIHAGQDQIEEILNNIEKSKISKKNSRFYFWVLVSKQCDYMEKKIRAVVKRFGPVPLTNYNEYCFSKIGILGDITGIKA